MKILKIFVVMMLTLSLASAATHHKSHVVQKVQKELTELGYHPGPIDGYMGPQTRRAIKTFQRSIHRRPTGHITKALLWQLHNMLNSAAAGFSQEAEERNGIKAPD
jgi:peptidoglycan hydrolase-like protein with peptidoglycan-binding domain